MSLLTGTIRPSMGVTRFIAYAFPAMLDMTVLSRSWRSRSATPHERPRFRPRALAPRNLLREVAQRSYRVVDGLSTVNENQRCALGPLTKRLLTTRGAGALLGRAAKWARR